jgi:hypothetical protein
MNAISNLSFPTYANAFEQALPLEAVRSRAPAVFATAPDERVSAKYTFIPTERVLTGLMSADFLPVDARQTHARRSSPLHARHILRLRRRYEVVSLKDSVPEVVVVNGHSANQSYEIRLGLFRVICTNGMIVSRGAFPAYRVTHRGNIVDEVIAGALKVAESFECLAAQVERMEERRLFKDEQVVFAARALALRFPEPAQGGIAPSQLLTCRRAEDVGDDLWHVFQRCQEGLLRGGFSRRSASGRLIRTRAISSISRDIELNGRLWDLAAETLAA